MVHAVLLACFVFLSSFDFGSSAPWQTRISVTLLALVARCSSRPTSQIWQLDTPRGPTPLSGRFSLGSSTSSSAGSFTNSQGSSMFDDAAPSSSTMSATSFGGWWFDTVDLFAFHCLCAHSPWSSPVSWEGFGPRVGPLLSRFSFWIHQVFDLLFFLWRRSLTLDRTNGWMMGGKRVS